SFSISHKLRSWVAMIPVAFEATNFLTNFLEPIALSVLLVPLSISSKMIKYGSFLMASTINFKRVNSEKKYELSSVNESLVRMLVINFTGLYSLEDAQTGKPTFAMTM